MEQNENQEFENTEEFNQEPVKQSGSSSRGMSDLLKGNSKLVYIGGGLLLLGVLWLSWQQLYAIPHEEEADNKLFRAEYYADIDSFNMALKGDGKNTMGLLAFVDEYGSTKAGKRASFRIGMIYLKQGKYDDAINYLENFDLGDPVIQPMATGAIGDCYSEKNDLDKAASYYIKAAEATKLEFPAVRFYKKAGLVYETKGEKDKALSVYETIKREYPLSLEAQDIDKYIARVKAGTSEK